MGSSKRSVTVIGSNVSCSAWLSLIDWRLNCLTDWLSVWWHSSGIDHALFLVEAHWKNKRKWFQLANLSKLFTIIIEIVVVVPVVHSGRVKWHRAICPVRHKYYSLQVMFWGSSPPFSFFFNPVCPSVWSQIDKHSGGTVSEVERNCHQALKQYGTFLIAFILTTGALHCMCSKEVTEVHTVHCLTILRGRISLKRIARENFKGS